MRIRSSKPLAPVSIWLTFDARSNDAQGACIDDCSLAVCGDPDQSIYAWRGADMRNILMFEEHYPGAKVVLLEQNYRSTQTILDAANAVIANNAARQPKRLWTDSGSGEPITRYHAEDEGDEATFVASTAHRLTTVKAA